MLRKFFNWFSKSDEELDVQVQLPKDEKAKFILKVDGINIGMLYCETGAWYFKYTDDFKKHAEEYNDLSKTYQSDSLWPFFQIRIPGLKQPAIQEILEKEKIDKSNEVALLKRFGYKTITNPYQLITA
jgi:hypothetical protein